MTTHATSLPERLKRLRKEKGLTQAALAKIAGVSSPAVTQWEGGTTAPKTTPAEKMAIHFGLPISFFSSDVAESYVQSNMAKYGQQSLHIPLPIDTTASSIPIRTIPVLTWVQAGHWTPTIPITDAEITEWLPWYPHCGKNGFALIVSGESMLPKFEPDDRIYVNPDCEVDYLRTGDLIIVSCEDDSAATFKRLVVETDGMHLEALNPKYSEKTMKLTEGCRLDGKVVGMHRYI